MNSKENVGNDWVICAWTEIQNGIIPAAACRLQLAALWEKQAGGACFEERRPRRP